MMDMPVNDVGNNLAEMKVDGRRTKAPKKVGDLNPDHPFVDG